MMYLNYPLSNLIIISLIFLVNISLSYSIFQNSFVDISNKLKASNQFDPYADNGGTVLGICGKDFCLIAADTRLSNKYIIQSRKIPRIFPVSKAILLTGSGCYSDNLAISEALINEDFKFKHETNQIISVEECSFLLANLLYSRRLFPYFSFCLLGGISKQGFGILYKYDAVGSFERVKATCSGKGEAMILPMLDEVTKMEEDLSLWDNSFTQGKFIEKEIQTFIKLSKIEAIDFTRKCFLAAAERDITIGDGLDIFVLEKSNNNMPIQLEKYYFDLPKH